MNSWVSLMCCYQVDKWWAADIHLKVITTSIKWSVHKHIGECTHQWESHEGGQATSVHMTFTKSRPDLRRLIAWVHRAALQAWIIILMLIVMFHDAIIYIYFVYFLLQEEIKTWPPERTTLLWLSKHQESFFYLIPEIVNEPSLLILYTGTEL